MNKIKILALFGKSGSGKDTIQRWIVSHIPNTKRIVGYTTRPKRSYEKDGIDYYFITEKIFTQLMMDTSLIEATCFNKWYYGTNFDELDTNKINIGVFNINAIDCLLNDPRLNVLPVLIEADDLTRLKRNLDREVIPNCTEICRRFLTDEKDFNDIPFTYETFLNKNSNTDWFNIQNIPAIKQFFADEGQNN